MIAIEVKKSGLARRGVYRNVPISRRNDNDIALVCFNEDNIIGCICLDEEMGRAIQDFI
jgi:hypothetical protein